MQTQDGPSDWRAEALCAQVDPELFFPEQGFPSHHARAVCARCPVAAECLDWALTHPSTVVADPDLPLPRRTRSARQHHRHRGLLAISRRLAEEVVERVVDQLSQTLPRRELDVTKYRQEPRVRPDVDRFIPSAQIVNP